MTSRREPSYQQIKQHALTLLARREHSCWELSIKLQNKGYPHEVVHSVVHALNHEGWVSDERFCRCFVKHRYENAYGPLRIAWELRQRGITEDLIKAELAQYEGCWWDSILRAFRKRFGSLKVWDRKTKLRCIRYLRQRGFDQRQIEDLFANVMAEPGDVQLG